MVLLAGYLDADSVARYEVVMCREWRGTPSAPLSPWETFRQIGALIAPYGNPIIASDQHSGDSNVDICGKLGLKLLICPITAQNRSGLFEALKGPLLTGTIQLAPDRTLASDLASVRRRLTVTGISYDLPRTGDGRHADYVPALFLALANMGDTSAARAAAAQAERMQRLSYVGMALHGGPPPELAHLGIEDLAALSAGADLDAMLRSTASQTRGSPSNVRSRGHERLTTETTRARFYRARRSIGKPQT